MTTFTISNDYGYVIASVGLYAWGQGISGIMVGMARGAAFTKNEKLWAKKEIQAMNETAKKEFGEELDKQGYPDMGNGLLGNHLDVKDWVLFNRAQRSHYKVSEGASSFVSPPSLPPSLPPSRSLIHSLTHAAPSPHPDTQWIEDSAPFIGCTLASGLVHPKTAAIICAVGAVTKFISTYGYRTLGNKGRYLAGSGIVAALSNVAAWGFTVYVGLKQAGALASLGV